MVLVVLCYGIEFFVLFAPYVRFHILVKFVLLGGRQLGNSCVLGLRINMLTALKGSQFIFFFTRLTICFNLVLFPP